MSVLLGISLLLFGGAFFVRSTAKARSGGAWAGPRSKGMQQRRQATGGQPMRPLRQELKLLREKTRMTDWLEQQRHGRKNGTRAAGAVTSAGSGATVTHIGTRQPRSVTSTLRRFTPSRKPAANGSSNGAPSPPPAPPAQRRPDFTPARTPAPPSAPANGTAPGRNTTVATGNGTGTGSAEKLIEGVNQVHAEAGAGGIHAKHGAIKACTEGSLRFSAMAGMMSRAMSEPGQNYGPEITEPMAKAQTHLQAAAMAFSEADSNLSTLINMSVGDLANSARQAPNHAELTENGSR